MSFSENIKALRKAEKLNQADLGLIIGVTGASVSEYEKGRAKPTVDTLMKMAKHFDVSVDDLLFADLRKDIPPPAPLTPSDISPDFDPQKYIVKSVVRNEAKVDVLWRLMVERERQSGKSTEQIQAETDRLFREAMERTREDMTGEE